MERGKFMGMTIDGPHGRQVLNRKWKVVPSHRFLFPSLAVQPSFYIFHGAFLFQLVWRIFQVRIDRANPFTPVSHAMPAQHGWKASAWPYQADMRKPLRFLPRELQQQNAAEWFVSAFFEFVHVAGGGFFTNGWTPATEGIVIFPSCHQASFQLSTCLAVHGENTTWIQKQHRY